MIVKVYLTIAFSYLKIAPLTPQKYDVRYVKSYRQSYGFRRSTASLKVPGGTIGGDRKQRTVEDYEFGQRRKRTPRTLDPYERHIHYQGTWGSLAARQRYIDAVRERLDAIAQWRGVTEER